MKVLSLFDGISCLRVALGDRPVEYLASEIDKNAIKIAMKNYPTTKQLGNVCDISGITDLDLLCGGSPCTDLSIAKKGREGLKGDRSKLFYEFVRIWKESKPKWFILENVASMPKKDKDIISEILGVEPVMINAALVSAQNRKRLFWTNIPVVGLPPDRNILLKDILQPDSEVDERMVMKGKSYCLTANYFKATESNSVAKKQRTMIRVGHLGESDGQANRIYSTEGKSSTLTTSGDVLVAKTGLYIGRIDGDAETPYVQRLEISDADKSNALSTVLKDNVIVKGCSIRGRLVDDAWKDKLDIRKDDKASAITSVAHSKLALVQIQVSDTGTTATVREATKKGFAIAKEGDSVDVSFPESKTRRGRVGTKAKNLMTSNNIGVLTKNHIRKLTPVECERLQSLPDNYTEGISMTARYKALGNAFNVEVIKFILSFIP
jgi:DNA (cytosine-5)-methyltransferase 3A